MKIKIELTVFENVTIIESTETGNKVSVTEEVEFDKALANLLKMDTCGCVHCVDCYNCVKCSGCTNCTECASCVNCTQAHRCEKCVCCVSCSDCLDCESCYNCDNVTNCSNCNKSKHSYLSENVGDPVKSQTAENPKREKSTMLSDPEDWDSL